MLVLDKEADIRQLACAICKKLCDLAHASTVSRAMASELGAAVYGTKSSQFRI
jgi:hypothetical protein